MLGLGQNQTAQLGQQLGVAPDQMTSALEAAVPLLLSQMGHNAQDPPASRLALAGARPARRQRHRPGAAGSAAQSARRPGHHGPRLRRQPELGGQRGEPARRNQPAARHADHLDGGPAGHGLPQPQPQLGRRRYERGPGRQSGRPRQHSGQCARRRRGGRAGQHSRRHAGRRPGHSRSSPNTSNRSTSSPSQTPAGWATSAGCSAASSAADRPQQSSSSTSGGVGLEPINPQPKSRPGSGNPLEDLIGMFGGTRR